MNIASKIVGLTIFIIFMWGLAPYFLSSESVKTTVNLMFSIGLVGVGVFTVILFFLSGGFWGKYVNEEFNVES